MKSIVIILLCALSFALTSCGNAPEHVDTIAPGGTSFTVFCATTTVCRERAAEQCKARGYSHFDIVGQLNGDGVDEGKGIIIQCKDKA
jgi:hypothetical protein